MLEVLVLIQIVILILVLPDEEEVFAESYDDKAEDKSKFSTDVQFSSDKINFMVWLHLGIFIYSDPNQSIKGLLPTLQFALPSNDMKD